MAMDPAMTMLRVVDISGPTLASLLHDVLVADRDVDGLLFGRVAQRMVSTVSDHEEATSSQETIATITGFCCSGRLFSFYDPSGAVDPPQLARVAGDGVGEGGRDPVIGWFVARQNTPLRPSMREAAVTSSLRRVSAAVPGAPHPEWPLLFALFDTFQTQNQATHTHDYRVFQCRKRAATWQFDPLSVNIVNIGPFFRGQFDSFSPTAPFPTLPLYPRGLESPRVGLPSHSRTFSDSSGGGDDEPGGSYLEDQAVLDRQTEGYSLEKLRNLVGREAPPQMLEMETLYRAMLGRLEKLAKDTCRASEAVHEQVETNLALRNSNRQGPLPTTS